MKGVFKVFLIIFGCAVILVGSIALKAVLFPVNTVNKSIDMAYEVTDEILTAENAIYNYEWFKTQEAHIRECMKNEELAKEEYDYYLSMLPDDHEKWTRDDKREENSLRNSYYALRKLTNEAIEEYNAKSSMVSRNIFKDNLPSNISRAFYTGTELTK